MNGRDIQTRDRVRQKNETCKTYIFDRVFVCIGFVQHGTLALYLCVHNKYPTISMLCDDHAAQTYSQCLAMNEINTHTLAQISTKRWRIHMRTERCADGSSSTYTKTDPRSCFSNLETNINWSVLIGVPYRNNVKYFAIWYISTIISFEYKTVIVVVVVVVKHYFYLALQSNRINSFRVLFIQSFSLYIIMAAASVGGVFCCCYRCIISRSALFDQC